MAHAGVRALALATLALTASPVQGAEPGVAIEIQAPVAGEVARGVRGMGFLAGHVLGHSGDLDVTDLMIAIDVSDSTSAPSGTDIDGDGKARGPALYIPIVSDLLTLFTAGLLTDETDTVLAAEISAARQLLDQLDSRHTRVGAITFSGDTDADTLDADVIAPLTHDYEVVRRALDGALVRGPVGRTNIAAAISLATVELIAARSAQSKPRPGARKVALLFSDGRPTLPFDGRMDENRKVVVESALRAARSGIRIRSYGVGVEADEACLAEVARVSQGSYTPVLNPGGLPAEVAKLELVEVAELQIENLGSGEKSAYLRRSPDGSFFALLPMRPGRNPIEVTARPASGELSRKRFEIEFSESADVAEGAPLDAAQARVRRELYEQWLADLKQAGVAEPPAEGTR